MSKPQKMSESPVSNVLGLVHNGGAVCMGEACVYCELNRMQGYCDDETLGKLLTLADASIIEERQNKSFKDLFKQIFREGQWNKSVSIEKTVKDHLDGTLLHKAKSLPSNLPPLDLVA